MRRVNRGTLEDLLLVGLFAVVASVIVVLTDAHERFDRWVGRHEE